VVSKEITGRIANPLIQFFANSPIEIYCNYLIISGGVGVDAKNSKNAGNGAGGVVRCGAEKRVGACLLHITGIVFLVSK
jgi:hypothetical protein